VASRPTCPNLATSTRGQKSTTQQQAHRRTVTVTATDYEFQRAVLCCLAAGWSQSPSTLMCSHPAWAAPPMCQHVRLMQSPACIKHLCMRLLNVRHHLASAHNPEAVPASTQCSGREASRCWQQACMVPKAWQTEVLGMCSAQTSWGRLVSSCSNNPVAVVKLGSSHKQVSTAAALACGGVQHDLCTHICAVCLDTLVPAVSDCSTPVYAVREPCTHATARTSLQQQRVCSRVRESMTIM
jgi:hypothetical protein